MSKFGHSPYAYCLICAWWIPKFGHWRPNAQGKTGFCSGQCVQANGLYISDISIYLPYFGYIFYWLGYRKFLPKLRKNAKVEPFKRALDDFLQAAPDEPTVQGCQRATASNSLFHQIPMGRVTNGCQLRWKAIMWRTKHVKISNKRRPLTWSNDDLLHGRLNSSLYTLL